MSWRLRTDPSYGFSLALTCVPWLGLQTVMSRACASAVTTNSGALEHDIGEQLRSLYVRNALRHDRRPAHWLLSLVEGSKSV